MSRPYEVGKGERIAGEIRSSILAGDFAPGERVAGVWDIQERFGCTYNTSIRVLWLLAHAGVVTTRRGTPTTVPRPDEVIAFAEARIAEMEEIRNWAARLKEADVPGSGSR
jgi:DNA-binding FadR family transcriptional regulator